MPQALRFDLLGSCARKLKTAGTNLLAGRASWYNTGLLKGLRAIRDLPRLVRRVLLYDGGHTFRTEDGIDVWPVNQFLEALQTDELWP